MKYILVQEKSQSNFIRIVNEKLKEGFELHGSVMEKHPPEYRTEGNIITYYVQAMIKKEEI